MWRLLGEPGNVEVADASRGVGAGLTGTVSGCGAFSVSAGLSMAVGAGRAAGEGAWPVAWW